MNKKDFAILSCGLWVGYVLFIIISDIGKIHCLEPQTLSYADGLGFFFMMIFPMYLGYLFGKNKD